MKRNIIPGVLILLILGCNRQPDTAALEARVNRLESDVALLQSKIDNVAASNSAKNDLQAEKEFKNPESEENFVASRNSDKFHNLSCSSANRISAENIVGYRSREQAIEDGKVPCKRCNP